MITWENYEEFMMLYADGELTPHEAQELMAFVNKHTELKKELAVYELSRLTPDTTQVFADKNSLLKPVSKKSTIAFPQWGRYSIAAGVAALIFISLFKYMHKDNQIVEFAKTDTVKPQPNLVAVPPVVVKNTGEGQNSSAVTKQDTNIVKSIVHADSRVAIVHKVTKEHIKQNGTEPMQPVIKDAISISELSLAEIKEIPHNNDKTEPRPVKEIPVLTVQYSNEEAKKTLWDKLPMDDIKKKQIENIAGVVSDVYNEVNTAKQNLYDKSITIDVKVEKRKLIISF